MILPLNFFSFIESALSVIGVILLVIVVGFILFIYWLATPSGSKKKAAEKKREEEERKRELEREVQKRREEYRQKQEKEYNLIRTTEIYKKIFEHVYEHVKWHLQKIPDRCKTQVPTHWTYRIGISVRKNAIEMIDKTKNNGTVKFEKKFSTFVDPTSIRSIYDPGKDLSEIVYDEMKNSSVVDCEFFEHVISAVRGCLMIDLKKQFPALQIYDPDEYNCQFVIDLQNEYDKYSPYKK